MTAARVTREAVDALLDHAAAQAQSLDELRSIVWFATDVLLEVDSILRFYGIDAEEEATFAAVRHYLQTCPLIAPDLHRLPLPERPQTPGTGVGGEAAPVLGSNVDIAVEEQIRHAFDELKVTEDEDGRP